MIRSEFSLIDYIKSKFSDITPDNTIGIGDDCAVLPYNDTHYLVVTTDMLVENIHFLRNHITPFELGRKSVTVNLSDIAAMGAQPIGITLSIAIPETLDDTYLEAFINGVRSLNTPLLGGDTTRSKNDFTISITALGIVEHENLKLRSQAQISDTIYVTGCLGDSSAGLHAILNNIDSPTLISAHHNPTAHLSQGLKLGRNPNVHAMMDVSDGIASDLLHILNASNLSAIVDTTKIPLSNTLINYCKSHSINPLHFALEGGEDYVLLFTASPDERFDFPVYPIGKVTSEKPHRISWLPEGNFKGFTHF